MRARRAASSMSKRTSLWNTFSALVAAPTADGFMVVLDSIDGRHTGQHGLGAAAIAGPLVDLDAVEGDPQIGGRVVLVDFDAVLAAGLPNFLEVLPTVMVDPGVALFDVFARACGPPRRTAGAMRAQGREEEDVLVRHAGGFELFEHQRRDLVSGSGPLEVVEGDHDALLCPRPARARGACRWGFGYGGASLPGSGGRRRGPPSS